MKLEYIDRELIKESKKQKNIEVNLLVFEMFAMENVLS